MVEPLQRVDELAAVVGRRGGKSRALATFACYTGVVYWASASRRARARLSPSVAFAMDFVH
jgi:hypothetical protein